MKYAIEKFNWKIQLRKSIGKYSWEIQFGNRVEKCICQHIGTVLGINREHTTMVAAPHHCAQSYTHNINFDNQQSYTTIIHNNMHCKLLHVGIWPIYVVFDCGLLEKKVKETKIYRQISISMLQMYTIWCISTSISAAMFYSYGNITSHWRLSTYLLSVKKYNDTNPRTILLNKIYQKLVHYRCTRCNLCQVLHFS